MIRQHRPLDDGGVDAAFDILLDEITRELERTNAQGSHSFGTGDYDTVEVMARRAKRIGEFKDRMARLQAQWKTLDEEPEPQRKSRTSYRRRGKKSMPSGPTTPRSEFYAPILRALEELGGTAAASDVIEHVRTQMASRMLPLDWEPIPSEPRGQRWRGTVSNARQILLDNGWMASGTPVGIWEITDAGRRWLAEQQNS